MALRLPRGAILCFALIALAHGSKLHASVVFTRAGERLPSLDLTSSRELTSLGAQQLHTAGVFFRNRYLAGDDDSELVPRTVSHIDGLSKDAIQSSQLLVMTPESQHTVASSQAFLQGLYPPHTLANTSLAPILDPESMSADGAYVENPLGGYQYAQIRTYSSFEPHIIYLEGHEDCPNYQSSIERYRDSTEFEQLQQQSRDVYEALRGTAMERDISNKADLNFGKALEIYEYLSYQYEHDKGTRNLLAANGTFLSGYFDRAGWYAAQQQWALNGDNTVDQGIRTMAGQTLAAQILGIFQQHIANRGSSNKLNLLFGDLEPFLAFASLASIDDFSTQFRGLPEHGSSMVFELFSLETENSTAFPSEDDMWVEFFYRNGTSDAGDDLRAYPIFHRGPSTINMKWKEFERSIRSIMTSNVGSWCRACGAHSMFCPAFDSSLFDLPVTHAQSHTISPAVAGVIGAFVTLAVVGLLGLALFVFGGLRLNSNGDRRRSQLGGYKGSAKMASDVDLIIPKAAVIAGQIHGRERVGSWELKEKEIGPSTATRWVDEEDDPISPYTKPVQPRSSL